MLIKYLLKPIQKALNYALTMDENIQNKLQALSGHVVQITITPLQLQVFICFQSDAVKLLSKYLGTVDTIITGSPIGLLKLMRTPASQIRSVLDEHLQITGDLELGQKVKHFIHELDLDLEGHLAKFTGDVVAYKVGSLWQDGRECTTQITNSICDNITDCLHEEWRLSPCREELNDFFQDVDNLVLDVERLIQLVEQKL